MPSYRYLRGSETVSLSEFQMAELTARIVSTLERDSAQFVQGVLDYMTWSLLSCIHFFMILCFMYAIFLCLEVCVCPRGRKELKFKTFDSGLTEKKSIDGRRTQTGGTCQNHRGVSKK